MKTALMRNAPRLQPVHKNPSVATNLDVVCLALAAAMVITIVLTARTKKTVNQWREMVAHKVHSVARMVNVYRSTSFAMQLFRVVMVAMNRNCTVKEEDDEGILIVL